MRWAAFGVFVAAMVSFLASGAAMAEPESGEARLKIAVFNVDATPPIGSPVAYAPVRKIEDPLSARGIVLWENGKPVVVCAVDWIGIGNGGHDVWRERLAKAAGTTPDRVAVHALHQHDGPTCDFTTDDVLAAHGARAVSFDAVFARKTIERTAAAIVEAMKSPREVTHLGVGEGKVEKVASNRRILGPDGKVKIVRWSKTADPEAIAAPEGLIDPMVKMLSFWNGEKPIACLTYYATHPQTYYRQGDVTSDFVGLARAAREKSLDGLPHVHFNGAGGNVTVGKYNKGTPESRRVLTERMAEGLRKAWESTEKTPISAADMEWRVAAVKLPASKHFDAEALAKTIADESAEPPAREDAAQKLAFLKRTNDGHETELSCLKLKNAYVLHMPGELFVEYQLAAQKMRPDDTVCMAAYGDYGPLYIGTEIAYEQGGYETEPRASNVAPSVEKVLMDGMRTLLK